MVKAKNLFVLATCRWMQQERTVHSWLGWLDGNLVQKQMCVRTSVVSRKKIKFFLIFFLGSAEGSIEGKELLKNQAILAFEPKSATSLYCNFFRIFAHSADGPPTLKKLPQGKNTFVELGILAATSDQLSFSQHQKTDFLFVCVYIF